ncbi:MAG: phosphatidate cytidylyltransferase [Clostridia bacterium]|nr:phosphatidate cytidylyltransferase [Clostridia bacterium]
MRQRTITSVAIISVALLLVILSDYIVYPIGLALLAVIAVFEMLRVMQADKFYLLSIPAYLLAAAFPMLAFFFADEHTFGLFVALAGSIFVYLMWLFGVSIFSKGKISFARISEVFVSVIYATISFTSMSLMRYMKPEIGVYFVVFVFVISWVCDTSAFAVGSLMGKHKLIPEISPKKTIEGCVGGIIFSGLGCLVYGLFLQFIIGDMSVNYPAMFVYGIILSVISQLGDLIASLLKREYGAKDYGTIFPGHGGIMDRFDSVLAVSTILMILCVIFPPFSMI